MVGWYDGAGFYFQCRGVLLIWIIVGQGPIALTIVAAGVVWTIFLSSLVYRFSFLSPSLGGCPIETKTQNNQPTKSSSGW